MGGLETSDGLVDQFMGTDSWLQPHLESVLRDGCSVLSSWRSQLPTLAGRTKNFENWILVQLNHQLLRTGFARLVLTNGFFADGQDTLAPKRIRAADVPDLRGSKSKATYISADLSVRPASGASGNYLIAELKTGMAAVELLDDLRLVRFYREKGIADRAELGWIVVLPTDDALPSYVKTFEKTCERLKKERDVLLRKTIITEWLLACVVVPTTIGPLNQALHPTAARL